MSAPAIDTSEQDPPTTPSLSGGRRRRGSAGVASVSSGEHFGLDRHQDRSTEVSEMVSVWVYLTITEGGARQASWGKDVPACGWSHRTDGGRPGGGASCEPGATRCQPGLR